jgi:hypothetical protein
MSQKYAITSGVMIERVGEDLMVIVPGHADVVKLGGVSAAVLLDVQAGTPVNSNDPVVAELVDLGIVSAPGLSRRRLIRVGAIGAGAGIAVLAMPGVAAASSVDVEELFGELFAGEWGNSSGAVYDNLELTSSDDWVAGVFIEPEGDAPYSDDDVDDDDPIRGTVVTGGKTYTAFLLNPSDGLGWYFLGTEFDPDIGDDFILTFTFGGKPYRVTQVENAD